MASFASRPDVARNENPPPVSEGDNWLRVELFFGGEANFNFPITQFCYDVLFVVGDDNVSD